MGAMIRSRSFETHSGWGAAVVLAAVVAGAPAWVAFLIGAQSGATSYDGLSKQLTDSAAVALAWIAGEINRFDCYA